MKHFLLLAHAKNKGATPPVCKTPMPVDRTCSAPEVTCPGCLDWIANNHELVIQQVAQVAQIRRSA